MAALSRFFSGLNVKKSCAIVELGLLFALLLRTQSTSYRRRPLSWERALNIWLYYLWHRSMHQFFGNITEFSPSTTTSTRSWFEMIQLKIQNTEHTYVVHLALKQKSRLSPAHYLWNPSSAEHCWAFKAARHRDHASFYRNSSVIPFFS